MKRKVTLLLCLIMCLSISIDLKAQSWQPIGPVDSTQAIDRMVDYASMTLDNTGNPYIAVTNHYNGNKAIVRKFDGKTWVNVGNANFTPLEARNIVIKISKQNIPFVAFYDGRIGTGQVSVMKYVGGSWIRVGNAGFASVAEDHIVGFSFALDSEGNPFLAYVDQKNNLKLTVKKYDGETWVSVGTGSISNSSSDWPCLTFNSSNKPVVAFTDGDFLAVLEYNGTDWVKLGGNSLVSLGGISYPSMVIGADGKPYIGFREKLSRQVLQTKPHVNKHFGASGDETETQQNQINQVDNNASGKATLIKYDGSNWVTVGKAGFSAGKARYINVNINSKGSPYVTYQDEANNYGATVMGYEGGNWVNIGNPNLAGFGPLGGLSMAFAANDNLYLGYYGVNQTVLGNGNICLNRVYNDDGNQSNAAVLKYNGSNWVTIGNSGISSGFAKFTIMAVSNGGIPYVIFQDGINGNKATVMQNNAGNWTPVGKPGISQGGASYTSIAITKDGSPYIVYSDEKVDGKATVMKYNGSDWVTVGKQGFSAGKAMYTSLAIDKAGNPFVVYCDSANGNSVTVKKYDGNSWIVVGNSSFSAGSAQYSSIKISANDSIYVAFSDGTKQYSPNVMKFNGSIWENVGNFGHVIGFAKTSLSLALGKDGAPYMALSNNVYKFNGNEWFSLNVPSFVYGKRCSELTIGNNGTLYLFQQGVLYPQQDKIKVWQYSGGKWDALGTTDHVTAGSAYYNSIGVDNKGNLFLTITNGGVWGYKYQTKVQ